MDLTLPTWKHLVLGLGYLLGFVVLFQMSELYWYPPAGLRFALLLLGPRSLFPWFVAGEVAFTFATNADHLLAQGLLAALPMLFKPVLAALGPWWLLRADVARLMLRPDGMARLLGAMLLSALLAGLATSVFPFALAMDMPWVQLCLQLMLGDFVGMLLLVPPALLLFQPSPLRAFSRSAWGDFVLVLLPCLALFLILSRHINAEQLHVFGVALSVLPVTYIAYRRGWRGTALAFPLSSIVIAMSRHIGDGGDAVLDIQMMLAVTGVVNLLLGASVDALRLSRRELERRNRSLLAANEHLDRMAVELREAARRNLGLSESIRRWVTAEVHDELGQNLTALQTHIKLIERRTGQPEAFEPVRGILQGMRASVSGLLARLRPAGLDAFGLVQSLQRGTIRNLVEANGMAYRIDIRQCEATLDRLDDDVQTAVYRIVQEAATNAVRHAAASCFTVRVCVQGQGPHAGVSLLVGDNGRGMDRRQRPAGVGLLGIRDRVLALGGRLHVRSRPGSTWLWVRLPASLQSGSLS